MSDIATDYFWCLRHEGVEFGDKICSARYLLGPYPSESQARQALADIAARNMQLDAEDQKWENDS